MGEHLPTAPPAPDDGRSMTRLRRSHLLSLAALLAAGTTLVAPTIGSTPAAATPSAPDELPWPDRRFAPCGAIDPSSDVLYAFGGRADDGATHLGDLWSLSPGTALTARPQWTSLAAAGSPGAPPPVRTCAAAWDPTGRRLIVFGGWDGVTDAEGVRAFDPADGEWRVLCDAVSCGAGPAPRRASGGGRRLAAPAAGVRRHERSLLRRPVGAVARHVDVDPPRARRCPADLTWRPLGRPRPIPGCAVPVRRHPARLRPRGRVASRSRRRHLDPTPTGVSRGLPAAALGRSPRPRRGERPTRPLRRVGVGDEHLPPAAPGQWRISTASRRGAVSLRASESPQARFYAIGGYDAALDRLVVFGGGSGGGAYKDTFVLTLPGNGSPSTWHTLSPVTPLTARDQAALVLDDGVLTTFGGFGAGTLPGTVDAGTHLADTWQRSLHRRDRWRLATPPDELPGARRPRGSGVRPRSRR